jgi:Tfp pilus assembly protein PilF
MVYPLSARARGPLLLAMTIALALVFGCAGRDPESPRQGDPARMSEAEYDVARDLWLRQARPRQALDHALRAVELDDENADALHLVALLYLDFCRQNADECRLKEAETMARKALAAKKSFREARNTLGVVLIHAGRFGEAIDVLKPLTQDILYTTPEIGWGNLGWAYLEKGVLDSAVDALKRSVAAQPLFCVGNYRLGLAHERRKEFALALEALTRALETQAPGCSNMQDAYLARARVHLEIGQNDEARADLTRCSELAPKSSAGEECRSMARKVEVGSTLP